MNPWTFNDLPDQAGRIAIVTGANTGIGLETARMLALRGATVILACRNLEKGQVAVERIAAETPNADVSLEQLDLSDLESIEAFAKKFTERHDKLDLLINNAGVMVPPFSHTKQGFELQFGTNHLGHFALTARLFPLLDRTPGSRIVVVSSTAQNFGKIAFDDLSWKTRSYSAFRAYGQSKLANIMFTLELARRLKSAGSHVLVTAAHPGYTATDLQRESGFVRRVLNPLLAMKAADGALPTLRAAVDPTAESGSYWGPANMFELNGPPVPAKISKRGQDEAAAAKLFEVSEDLVGLKFPVHGGEVVLEAAS
jgi:NAD(P)-dependent dehydrogenase (short-subunit alcohol dehydrogenase family)